MKKIFYFLAALMIGGGIAKFCADAWRSTAYLQAYGREGTLVIGQRYNASRWAGPLPLKKIHSYTAMLAPKHAVVIESDQELVAGRQYFIRFLTRDHVAGSPSAPFRPIPGTIRLRAADDGTPAKFEDTVIMDRLVEKAIGPLGRGHEPAKTPDPVVPGRHTDFVPFLLGGAKDGTIELIWTNSGAGEWVAVMLAMLFFCALLLHAWEHPWRVRRSRAELKKFVHPSLDKIEPSPIPPSPPSIPFKPGAASAATSANPPPPEAAPPPEPVLKLRRK